MKLNLILFILISSAVSSQSINDSINKEFITKTITYLTGDAFKGRGNYTEEQLEAAEFLSN